MNHDDLPEILSHVDPAILDYEEWLQVGMALHDSGLGVEVWDEWSRRDPARYHAGECAQKWRGFGRSSRSVRSGTIVELARAQGYDAGEGHALDWDDEISADSSLTVIDRRWIQDEEIPPPMHWSPANEASTYIETLFQSDEYVGFVTNDCWKRDEHDENEAWHPGTGIYAMTAGELLQKIARNGDDLGATFGDAKPGAGAWICFNPLDGKGVRDENVTNYRYALVESDSERLERQYAMIKKLELPVAILVHSGRKSLHAIVRIDAINYEEYRKRVDYLYEVCQKNGMKLDKKNRNPSRLSRLPGFLRGDDRQYIIARNIGQESFEAWKDYIEALNDNLPEIEEIAGVMRDIPPLKPELIRGVLREGHKLLLAGPSKAGKSFALIELTISIAEGLPWLGFPCEMGRVLYINLELDRASCLHRFADVYAHMVKVEGDRHYENIHVWNLRGKSETMDKLAPKLIRRAGKAQYDAIIIDPIYKIITGDENSADQMSQFCNQFDRVADALGCAVIYCHHHSKGNQGQKRSMDRASGSGVFARDPDAMIDLIELPMDDETRRSRRNEALRTFYFQKLREGLRVPEYAEVFERHGDSSPEIIWTICRDRLPRSVCEVMKKTITAIEEANEHATAWRIEGTLREFPSFKPRNLFFDYPIHRPDVDGLLDDVEPERDAPWGGNKERKKTPEDYKKERQERLGQAYDALNTGEPVKVVDMAAYLSCTPKTVYGWLKEFSASYVYVKGIVTRKQG